ncbi:uncharacterized protein LOC119642901 [Glossina fuscipes]|uniref:Uncharacterized protein LOC119642901 n=1 Tax=Glossina fuscipes TaxID=7396 RepID=A0A9C5ZEJ0_9MUSC|nr:uncharacterized protein LOC119642901 [Glossina fuscipes]KAI9575968.1 hypothetical protein GQX74_011769 [Glossina fuscipes]
MSYHLKSTPFFWRTSLTGKKNGQLQKLKEEHDRIKEFNGRTIDTKMCHVRLKRLFKEIEEIKETNLKRRNTIKEEPLKNQMPFYHDDSSKTEKNRRRSYQHRSSADQSKTMIQKRNEGGLSRAIRTRIATSPRKAKTDKDEQTSMTRVNRRLKYGNEVSNWNMQRMLTNNLSGEVKVGLRQTLKETRRFFRKPSARTGPAGTLDVINRNKNEKMKHCINYVNNVSPNTIPKTSRRRKKDAAAMDDVRTASNPNLTDGNMSQQFNFGCKPGEYFRGSEMTTKRGELFYSGLSSEIQSEDDDKRTIARKRWDKISEVISSRFDINKSARNLKTLEKCGNDLEYQLRTISNDTHLPQSQIMVQRGEQMNPSENNGDSLFEGEIFVNKEILLDVISRSVNATP